MDPNLAKVLAVFVMYCIPGIFCLHWVKNASSKVELFISGLFLIIWAAFTLATIAMVTGMSEALLTDKSINEASKDELKDFIPYVFFFGAIYTFLFGGVGTNAVSTSLLGVFSIERTVDIKTLEKKIEESSKQVQILKKMHWKYLIINIFLMAFYYWVSK